MGLSVFVGALTENARANGACGPGGANNTEEPGLSFVRSTCAGPGIPFSSALGLKGRDKPHIMSAFQA
jgi:hypothetical protein